MNTAVTTNVESEVSDNKFLTFKIANEQYGVGIEHVMEIIEVVKITPMPESEQCIKGVINLRGKVIPVMDIRLRFRLAEKEHDARTCIIVVKVAEAEMGLIVDTVSEVLDIPKDQMAPAPSLQRKAEQEFVMGMGKVGEEVIILLDLNKLLYSEEKIQKAS